MLDLKNRLSELVQDGEAGHAYAWGGSSLVVIILIILLLVLIF